MIVDCAVYRDGVRGDGKLPVEQASAACSEPGTFVWIGLHEPSEQEFDSVRREFNLHELAVEDAIKAHQRPKLEVYGDSLFVVLKPARYVDSEEVVEFGEILAFVGENFIITVRHGPAGELHAVREEIERRPERLRGGPGAVLHAIMDRVVDGYVPALQGLSDDIDEVEEQVFSSERVDSAQRIYKLKREVIEFLRASTPLVEPVERLARGQHELIHPEVRAYFRDVGDHLLRTQGQLEGANDLLTNILNAHLAQVTVRQNSDMRKISAWVGIVAVPTMIAGIYGMNFEHMPELRWELGYPMALAVMVVICLALYRYFKKVGWLE